MFKGRKWMRCFEGTARQGRGKVEDTVRGANVFLSWDTHLYPPTHCFVWWDWRKWASLVQPSWTPSLSGWPMTKCALSAPNFCLQQSTCDERREREARVRGGYTFMWMGLLDFGESSRNLILTLSKSSNIVLPAIKLTLILIWLLQYFSQQEALGKDNASIAGTTNNTRS